MRVADLEERLLGEGTVGRWIEIVGTLAAVAVALPLLPPNHDVTAVLDLAARWLDGERLYVDIPEPNPPLIFAWSVLPELLSRWSGVGDVLVVRLFTLAWTLGCIRLAVALLPAPVATRRAAGLVGAGILVAGSSYDLGQREQLFVASTLPWFVLLGAEARVGTRVGVALLGAFGFALKPFFGAAWLAGEVWKWRRGGSPLRLENAVLAASAVAYAGFALAVGYGPNALRWRGAYVAFDNPPADVWAMSLPWAWGAALAVALLVPPRGARGLFPLVILGGFAAGWAQHKGWAYHWVPLWSAAAVAVCAAPLGRPGGALVASVLSLAGLVVGHQQGVEQAEGPFGAAVERTIAPLRAYPGARVLWVTAEDFPMFPTVRLLDGHVINHAAYMFVASAYADVNPLADPFPYHTVADMPPLERETLDTTVADLRRAPTLVIIDQNLVKLGFGNGPTSFDWHRWLASDERFFTELAAHYRRVEGPPLAETWARVGP